MVWLLRIHFCCFWSCGIKFPNSGLRSYDEQLDVEQIKILRKAMPAMQISQLKEWLALKVIWWYFPWIGNWFDSEEEQFEVILHRHFTSWTTFLNWESAALSQTPIRKIFCRMRWKNPNSEGILQQLTLNPCSKFLFRIPYRINYPCCAICTIRGH